MGLLERLGVQYEQDHEKDLKETLPYLPEEAHGIGWQAPGAAGYVYGSASQGEETVNGAHPLLPLSSPTPNTLPCLLTPELLSWPVLRPNNELT